MLCGFFASVPASPSSPSSPLLSESAPTPPSSSSLTPSACVPFPPRTLRSWDDQNRRPPLGLRPVLQPVFPAHLCHVGADPQAPGRLRRNCRLVRPAVQSGHGRGGPQSKGHPRRRRFLSSPWRR